MSEKEFKKIFSKRLRYYLEKNNMTQAELAKHLGVGTTSVYNWCNALKTPRMDKVDAMCKLFGCMRRDLMEEDSSSYYINKDTREMVQFLFDNPEYKVLFDASRKVSKSDIATVKTIIDKFRRTDEE